jgi:hypothetical protein
MVLMTFSLFHIRIRIDFGRPYPDPGRQNDPQKERKGINFNFRSAGCSLLRVGFSGILDVLGKGQGKNKLLFLKNTNFFQV